MSGVACGGMRETAADAMRSWTPGIVALGVSEPGFWTGAVIVGVDERSRGASKRQHEVALNIGPVSGWLWEGQEPHARADEDMSIPHTFGPA